MEVMKDNCGNNSIGLNYYVSTNTVIKLVAIEIILIQLRLAFQCTF